MAQTIVDTHPHIVSQDTVRYPVTPLGGKQSDWSKEHSVTLEELISSMDAAGVHKAAVVHSSTTYGFNNQYVADAVARHPTRLTGVFSVNVVEPDAPKRMRHWFSLGCTGMRIFTRGSTMQQAWLAIDDQATMPAWTCAADLGLPVVVNVHCTAAGLQQMTNILQKFPSVKLLVDHVGRPPTEDGPPYAAATDFFRMSRFDNFHLKLTPTGLKNTVKGKATEASFLEKLVAEFGASRIMWGSNYPATSGTLADLLARTTASLAHLSRDDQEWILGKTALAVYPALANR